MNLPAPTALRAQADRPFLAWTGAAVVAVAVALFPMFPRWLCDPVARWGAEPL